MHYDPRFGEFLSMHRQALTGAELQVALFVIERTWGWKKEVESISLRQFLEGITSRGELRHRGTGLSESSVKRAIRSLHAKGYLQIRVSPTLNRASKYAMKIPKRLQKGQESGDGRGGQNEPTGGVKMNPLIINSKIIKTASPSASRSDVGSILEEARERSRAARLKKEAKGLTASALLALWDSLRSECCPEGAVAPTITDKEGHALRAYQKRFIAAGNRTTFPDYLRFVCENWTAIRIAVFDWMTSFPAVPSAFLLVRQCSRFEEYASEHIEGWQADRLTMPPFRKPRPIAIVANHPEPERGASFEFDYQTSDTLTNEDF